MSARGGPSIPRKIHRILRIVSAALLTAGGCTQPRPPMDETTLAGNWDVEMSRGRLPWNRTTVHGQIHLVSARLPPRECDPEKEERRDDAALCRTHVEGTYSIPLDSLTRPRSHARWAPDASAIVMADGAVVLLVGGCCDRGEISGKGRIDADRIEGHWVQQFLGDGPRGRFVMRRRHQQGRPDPRLPRAF